MPGQALTQRNRTFLNNLASRERPAPRRVLTASAQPLDLKNKVEARKLRVVRQGWQQDAAAYVDNLPELSFAYRFLAHASSRMRYFPALVNPEQPDGPPVPASACPGAPQQLVDDMNEAMMFLGVGRQAMSAIQEATSWNYGVTGECFLVGRDEPDGTRWKIRSIEEFMVFDDGYKLRQMPLDPQGTLGWEDLDPDTTYAARMWVPHWRFSYLATSPMRSLLDVSEELLLLSRDVRATARSRLAGGGILKWPEGLRVDAMLQDNDDPESESVFGQMTVAMMTPLADEGVASSVVPIVVSGEPDSLAQLDHLILDRPYSALAIELRAEAIGRIGTGLDVPREVLEGMTDPNHWGAWLVSDDTFRHHIEPQVITQVDGMSGAYMRPYLQAKGHPDYWIQRACIWYDPAELISKPDPMANAILLHDRYVISNKALLEAGGFPASVEPTTQEVEFRMLQKERNFPPNMVEALFHAYDPELAFPAITQAGEIPGISPSGVVVPAPPLPAAPPDTTTGPTPADTGAPVAPDAAAIGPPSMAALEPAAFAEAPPTGPNATQLRLSRRLAELDAQLRTRIQTAACGAMVRLLDRAGAKLRTKVNGRAFKNDSAKRAIENVPNRGVAQALGLHTVTAAGFGSSMELLNPDWSELKAQFESWTRAGQAQAVRVAQQLAKLPADSPLVTAARGALEQNVGPAWSQLETSLNQIAEGLLYSPDDLDAEEGAAVSVDLNTVVPTGVIRQALSIAGGLPQYGRNVDVSQPVDVGNSPVSAQASVQVPSGQIGTGDAITGMLNDAPGIQPASYEWVHGPTMRPFEPHEDLDGVSFTSFTDDALQNTGDFPENSYYFPGDHPGCSCDFATTWGDADEDSDATDDATGETPEDDVADEIQDAGE